MTIQTQRIALAALIFFISAPRLMAVSTPADLILKGGKVITMAGANKAPAAAVAVTAGKIVAVGSDAEISAFQGPATQVLALGGRTLVPGFVEGHGHLSGLGQKSMDLDLTGIKDPATIVAMVKADVPSRQPTEWVVGRGWDQNLWTPREFPTHGILTAVAPVNPVFLTRVDGHAGWANHRALDIAGITRSTPDPADGRIIRDAAGEPTGVLVDGAMALVRSKMPAMGLAEMKRALKLGMAASVALGITTFHDAGVERSIVTAYRELLAEGELPLRLFVMVSGEDREFLQESLAKGPETLGDDRLIIRSIKLMADGALGSRGAALLAPYSDDPKNSGTLILSEEWVYGVAKKALERGFQVATHAIGDRANKVVLDAYERALSTAPHGSSPRFRIEHAQILNAADIPRFARLGVLASMQPTHCTSDMPWVPTRIGQDRTDEGAYVWQKLLKSGATLVSGSDTPVESASPLWGIYAAVTRQSHEGLPAAGFNPEQRLTRDQALSSYTRDAAYAGFLETKTGTIEPGKAADLVVLSRDIMTIPVKELLETEVVMTLVAGKIVHVQPGANLSAAAGTKRK